MFRVDNPTNTAKGLSKSRKEIAPFRPGIFPFEFPAPFQLFLILPQSAVSLGACCCDCFVCNIRLTSKTRPGPSSWPSAQLLNQSAVCCDIPIFSRPPCLQVKLTSIVQVDKDCVRLYSHLHIRVRGEGQVKVKCFKMDVHSRINQTSQMQNNNFNLLMKPCSDATSYKSRCEFIKWIPNHGWLPSPHKPYWHRLLGIGLSRSDDTSELKNKWVRRALATATLGPK